MPLVSEVCDYLDRLAPAELAEDWDNVGLLVGRRSDSVHRAMTCLTLTADVAAEAIQVGAQMIITHHPVLFRGIQQITDETVEGKMLLDLIRSGIAVYSAHTRFDSAQNGINQQLADGFGLIETGPIRPSESLPGLGSGRIGRLPDSMGLSQFLKRVRAVTGARHVEFCGELDAKVSRVGVACGSAAEFLDDAADAGCDTFVTGEARFHSVLDARSRGISLILTGHYPSERRAMENLAEDMQKGLPDLEVRASEQEYNPLRVDIEVQN